MLYFLQQTLLGIHAGAIYALLAFGYVLVNGLLRRTNLAHGAAFAFCGHAMILATLFGWNALWLTWPAAIGFGSLIGLAYATIIGMVLSRHIFEPLRAAAPNTIVTATLGVAIVLMEASRIAAGTRDYWLPPLLASPVTFASGEGFAVTMTLNQIAGCLVIFATLATSSLFLARSNFGRNWQAVADDPFAAALCGVDPPHIFRLASIFAALLAAISGILAATYYGNISFGTGLVYGLKVLFVTAAGSYTSPLRASLGAFAFGIGETIWTGYFPSEWRDAWMLAFLAATLILRHSAINDAH